MVVALIEKRREAIRLRKSGLPYSDIRRQLGVSKSSLSYWLHNVEMAEPHIRTISTNWIARRVETYRQTVKERTKKLEARRLAEAQDFLGTITERDVRIAGLFLYLGEGLKVNRWAVGISNSDPEVIRFGVKWLVDSMKVPKEKLTVRLHLYRDMDIEKEVAFWSNASTVPLSQFGKPYIKKSLFSAIDYKTHGHGTCNIIASKGEVKQKIMAEIKTIMDSVNKHP